MAKIEEKTIEKQKEIPEKVVTKEVKLEKVFETPKKESEEVIENTDLRKEKPFTSLDINPIEERKEQTPLPPISIDLSKTDENELKPKSLENLSSEEITIPDEEKPETPFQGFPDSSVE